MELERYVDHLRSDLSDAAAAGGPEVAEAAQRLSAALEPAVRMTLLEALADAAADITAELDRATVDVRLKGREPQIVVQQLADVVPAPPPAPSPPAPPAPPEQQGETEDGDETITRVTVRLSDSLKSRAEDRAAQRMQSLNSYILQAIAAAVDGRGDPAPDVGRPGRSRSPRRVQGWSR